MHIWGDAKLPEMQHIHTDCTVSLQVSTADSKLIVYEEIQI